VAGLLLLSRLPKVWYFKNYLTPPIAEYKRAKAQGRVLSTKKLSDFYTHLCFFCKQGSILYCFNMGFSIIAIVILDRIFLIGTLLSGIALTFTGIITASISLCLSYFVCKSEVSPLLEEIQLQLESVPDVKNIEFL